MTRQQLSVVAGRLADVYVDGRRRPSKEEIQGVRLRWRTGGCSTTECATTCLLYEAKFLLTAALILDGLTVALAAELAFGHVRSQAAVKYG